MNLKWKRSFAAALLALFLILPACDRGKADDPAPDSDQPSQGIDLDEWRRENGLNADGDADQAEPAEDLDAGDSDNESETVYVTKTGEKYHRSGCQYLRKSKIPISLSEVKQDYDPCSKCNPPE